MTHCRFTLRGGSCDADSDTVAADSCERYGGVSSGHQQGCECMCTQDNNTISVIAGVRCIHTLSGKAQPLGSYALLSLFCEYSDVCIRYSSAHTFSSLTIYPTRWGSWMHPIPSLTVIPAGWFRIVFKSFDILATRWIGVHSNFHESHTNTQLVVWSKYSCAANR